HGLRSCPTRRSSDLVAPRLIYRQRSTQAMGFDVDSEVQEAYRPAVQELELLIGEVAVLEHEAREHGEIEKHLERRGMEVMRQLFQCYLNRVAGAEEKQQAVVAATGSRVD